LTQDSLSYEVAIDITATHGKASSNKIGAYVHQVESQSCDSFPWNGTPSTDRMGLNENITPQAGDTTQSYTELNITRGFTAPNTCWNTDAPPSGTAFTVTTFSCSLIGGD
jgi:hypothetical protein